MGTTNLQDLEIKIEAKQIEFNTALERIGKYSNPVPLEIDTPPGISKEAQEDYKLFNKVKKELEDLKIQKRDVKPIK